MTAFLSDLWTAFHAVREARRHIHPDELWQRRGALKQAARLALMSDTELLASASQWGAAVCRRELQRRGLALGGQPTTSA